MSLLLPGEPCGVFASRSLYEMRLPPGSVFRTPWRWKGRASFGSQFPLYANYTDCQLARVRQGGELPVEGELPLIEGAAEQRQELAPGAEQKPWPRTLD